MTPGIRPGEIQARVHQILPVHHTVIAMQMRCQINANCWSTLTLNELYRSLFIALTLPFLGLEFRKRYVVPHACTPGTSRADPHTRSRQRRVFWTVAIGLLAVLAP